MSSESEDTEDLCLVATYIPVVFLMVKGFFIVALLTCMFMFVPDIRVVSCTALFIWFVDYNQKAQSKLERACGGVAFVILGFILHIMGSWHMHKVSLTRADMRFNFSSTAKLTISGVLSPDSQNDDGDYVIIVVIDILWACASLIIPFLPYNYTAMTNAMCIYACCVMRYLVSWHNPHAASNITIMDLHFRVILYYVSCAVVFFCRSSCRTYNYYTPVMVSFAILVITAHVCVPMVMVLIAVHVMQMRAKQRRSMHTASLTGIHKERTNSSSERKHLLGASLDLENGYVHQNDIRHDSKKGHQASVELTLRNNTSLPSRNDKHGDVSPTPAKTDTGEGDLMQQLLAAKAANGLT